MKQLNKICTVIGTRPQAIKVDREIPQTLIWSGQHYDYEMSQVFFKELKLPKPDYNLECKGYQVGRMLDKLRMLFKKLKPSLIIVYGDCNTTLAGALAGVYENIPVAHIEAGLRCGRMDMPEEINRILTDRIATYRFCPTDTAVRNLEWEGIRENVFNVGDVLFDAMNPFCPIKKTKEWGKYALLTIHRQENLKPERLRTILRALSEVKQKIIFPVHPHTRQVIAKNLIMYGKNIKVIPPVGYKRMLELESNAKHIITDSGGVTREAYWMQKPITSLRKETEWPETVKTGWNTLVNADPKKIIESLNGFNWKNTEQPVFEYGAKEKIRKILDKYL